MTRLRAISLAAAAVAGALVFAGAARAAQLSQNMRVAMSDGVTLQATLTGDAPLAARPVIVEFSPYGPGSGTTYDGPAYNYLLVQIRGTGDSDGEFDALGKRTQADVVQTLQWACHQPWSDGKLGLNGFSASAITVYNSLHLGLPCVRTAVLRSGTFELYRDLLWPGGISNFLPGFGVLALIGAPAAAEGFNRAQRDPISGLDTAIGLTDAGLSGGFVHPSLDSWWQERGFRGDANHLPILMIDSFFDVESRGAFQAYQQLRGDGAHLLVVAGHDGAPAGTDGASGATKSWFDRYLSGTPNGIEHQLRVQLLMSDGSREGYLGGKFVRYDTTDWPAPGTQWESLWLDATRSGSGHSTNDGSLVDVQPKASTVQSYAAIPTIPSVSDQPNTAIVGPDGINQAAQAFPVITQTALGEPQALTYTTAPLRTSVLAAGPAALDLRLSSTAQESDLWAVISDVWPDGTSHPVATGRLLSSYPNVVASKSLVDQRGNVVQPYGDYSVKTYTSPGKERSYQVEFWPIGNRFEQGHRIRLVILGASTASRVSGAALNSVRVGGAEGSRLLLPLLPATPPPASTPAVRAGCPPAAGRLRGRFLGPVSLGMSRAQVRRALRFSSTHGRPNMDYFCLAPIGVRVGYAPAELVRQLPRGRRDHLLGSAVLALSANPYYSLAGIHPGVRLATARRSRSLIGPFRVGVNQWYLIGTGASRGVLKVRSGVIQEIGVANGELTSARQAAARFFRSFG